MKVLTWMRLPVATAIAAAAVACGTITAAEGEVLETGTPPGIRVEALGGIAALHAIADIDSAAATGAWSMGPICPEAMPCTARDTLVGAMSRGAIDAFFLRTSAPAFRSLRADYGWSADGADLRGYVVTIRANGRTRTLRADDGTMPTLMAQFVNDVNGAVIDAIR